MIIKTDGFDVHNRRLNEHELMSVEEEFRSIEVWQRARVWNSSVTNQRIITVININFFIICLNFWHFLLKFNIYSYISSQINWCFETFIKIFFSYQTFRKRNIKSYVKDFINIVLIFISTLINSMTVFV